MHKSSLKILALIFMISSTVLADEQSRMFTKEETIKVVSLMDYMDWPICSRANPEAKMQLRELLKTQSGSLKKVGIIQMLGYVGDRDDVATMAKILEDIINKPDKKLTRQEKDYFGLTAKALGIMSRRGIDEAKSVAKKVFDETEWIKFGEKFYIPHTLKASPDNKYMAMYIFLTNYAVSGDPDIENYRLAFIKKIAPEHRDKTLWLFDKAEIAGACKVQLRTEQKPLQKGVLAGLNMTPEQIEELRRRSRKKRRSGNEPKPPIKKAFSDDGHLNATVNEAIKAYTQITKTLLDDESEQLDNCVSLHDSILNFQKPILPQKWKTKKDRLINGLKQQRQILIDVHKAKLKQYANFSIKIDTEVVFQDQPQESGKTINPGQPFGHEVITVTFIIPGSAEIYKKYFRQVYCGYGGSTMGKKGDLKVYMKKINGKWGWNPFNW